MIKNALIGIAFVGSVASFVISMYNQNVKMVYIEMGKVYEEFQLSKELNNLFLDYDQKDFEISNIIGGKINYLINKD